ncbi:GspH/FimT family pseudopilin [Rhodoligotrophos defluvii]|uniref:GspH/FimT family pseudopilin n=1 Tax=Rhodoligotrophos defluvii TaxID=2561934 RepID=UPI0010C9C64A|nr:GspH/FimT family pseudopilin [Rhodoligotrophos defluvii]
MARIRTSRLGSVAPAARGDSGFTLLELLVVLTIAALISGLAIPIFAAASPRLQISSTAAEIVTALRSARRLAIAQSREQFVEFNLSARTYRLSSERARREIPARFGIELVVARSEVPKTGIGRVLFYPDGTSTGGHIRLSLGALSRKVAVDWFDGSATARDE